jgi:hypothetical protein
VSKKTLTTVQRHGRVTLRRAAAAEGGGGATYQAGVISRRRYP